MLNIQQKIDVLKVASATGNTLSEVKRAYIELHAIVAIPTHVISALKKVAETPESEKEPLETPTSEATVAAPQNEPVTALSRNNGGRPKKTQ